MEYAPGLGAPGFALIPRLADPSATLHPFTRGRALLIQLAEKDAVDDLCYLVESGQADLYRDVELRDAVLFVGHPPITDL